MLHILGQGGRANNRAPFWLLLGNKGKEFKMPAKSVQTKQTILYFLRISPSQRNKQVSFWNMNFGIDLFVTQL